MTKLPLSAIITTFNEEEHIEALLQQLDWVDEVLVVDSFSSDKTVELIEAFDVTLVQRKYTGPAEQKNWALQQVKHPWVLILDADERITTELKTEIQTFLQNPSTEYAGYWIRRNNFFMGKRIRYSGMQGDKVIRLVQPSLCAYNNKQVHEEIESIGKIGFLDHPLEHYTYKNLRHFLAKMERYAFWSAQDYAHKTPKITLYHLCLKPFFRFCTHFVVKRGFLDGRIGFMISCIMAWGVFLRYAALQEHHRNEALNNQK